MMDSYQNTSNLPLNEGKIYTPPELKEKYTFIKKIGHGAQADVYEAVQNDNQKHVAIKQLNINSIKNWKEYELFERESLVLKELNIDGIARVYETVQALNQDDPHAYIVQQFINGRTLAQMIQAGYRFNLNETFKLAIQLINLLEKLHKHNPPIVHRDIKPSNIMLEYDGNEYKAYLIDFGAVANPIIQKGGSTVAGTFGYMPPEQQTGHPTPASDIYALGATICYMLSGIEPSDMEIVEFRLAIEKPLETVPDTIVSCLRQMLIPREQERLCDYDILRQRFTAFTNNQFTNIDQQSSAVIKNPRDYELALTNVAYLNQPNNLALWLELPESTPRAIPKPYQNFLFQYPKSNKSINKQQSSSSLFIFLTTIFIIFFVVAIFSAMDDSFSVGTVIALLSVSILPLILGCVIRTNSARSLKIPKLTRTPSYLLQYNTVLKHGRKSMATVVSIEYQKANSSYVEQYRLDDHDDPEFVFDHAPMLECYAGGYMHRAPTFRVTYKFNPPDDSSPDDLFHEIILNYDPSDTLKVGDMLPILYLISPEDNKMVTSIPFPLPLKRMHSMDGICASSINK